MNPQGDAAAPVYEDIGKDYNANRRADSRVVERLIGLLNLPQGSRIADVAAGTGNYTNAVADAGYHLVGIEPSHRMARQAAHHEHVNWALGVGESLPLGDGSVDGIMLTIALHHFESLAAAGVEMRRVCPAGPIVLFLIDPRRAQPFWFADYFPQIRARMFETYRPIEEVERLMFPGEACEVVTFALPHDFTDQNMHSGWNRPEIYLDPVARQNMSPFALATTNEVESGISRLGADLTSGAWDAAYGQLRDAASMDLGFRFLVRRGQRAKG